MDKLNVNCLFTLLVLPIIDGNTKPEIQHASMLGHSYCHQVDPTILKFASINEHILHAIIYLRCYEPEVVLLVKELQPALIPLVVNRLTDLLCLISLSLCWLLLTLKTCLQRQSIVVGKLVSKMKARIGLDRLPKVNELVHGISLSLHLLLHLFLDRQLFLLNRLG